MKASLGKTKYALAFLLVLLTTSSLLAQRIDSSSCVGTHIPIEIDTALRWALAQEPTSLSIIVSGPVVIRSVNLQDSCT